MLWKNAQRAGAGLSVLLGAGLLAAPASTNAAHRAAQPAWSKLHRPLHLSMGEGECSSARLVRLSGKIRGAGNGPIYPTTSPWVLSPDPRHPGLIGEKLIWAWPEKTTKAHLRVLVRGIRLDGPGTVRFVLGPQFDTARVTTELRVDTSRTVGSFSGSTWGTTVSEIFVPEPGCYGLQLDWAGGSRVLKFKATRRT
jgi:hypothetical protein